MSSSAGGRLLHSLARLYGLQTAYYDVFHQRQPASTESLLAVLHSLGAPLATLQDVRPAWRERRQELWQRTLEPVVVAWQGVPSLANIRLPLSAAEATLNCHLKLETGAGRQWQWHGGDLAMVEAAEVEGRQYVVKQLPLPRRLPRGYHQLTLELPGRQEECLVISAPMKAYTPRAEPDKRSWGVFLPLYALHTPRSWGGGDFSALEELISWVAGLGAKVVATLPLLATFLNDICEPSPYRPASRLLWNEFYLDINQVPELRECPAAQALLASSSFQAEIESLRQAPLVDYSRQMALKRQALEELSRGFFAKASRRLEDFQHFIEANPVVEDYARFRATGEKQHISWRSWSQPARQGILKAGDYDEANKRYHLYVQWLAQQQMEHLATQAREQGLQLYLDLPLGVHPDGYDVWREADAFLLDTAAGAPPDTVFTKGQNWGFPPLHPARIREQGYRYVIAYLRHHLRQAGILRIDHVMGLHRLFCIPQGMATSQGVYLRYPAEELYAIVALESQRHRTIIVGEDLGTVPPEVRPAMKQHGLQCMYVVRYELASNPPKGLRPVASNAVASLNTHDMPPFAAFWQGLDIAERVRLGLLDKTGAEQEKENLPKMKKALTTFLQDSGFLHEPEENMAALVKACLSLLAASRTRLVLVNLEDLWLETQPQNVPSTTTEYPNWQHKARYRLAEFCQMPQLIDTLRTINKLRPSAKHQ